MKWSNLRMVFDTLKRFTGRRCGTRIVFTTSKETPPALPLSSLILETHIPCILRSKGPGTPLGSLELSSDPSALTMSQVSFQCPQLSRYRDRYRDRCDISDCDIRDAGGPEDSTEACRACGVLTRAEICVRSYSVGCSYERRICVSTQKDGNLA